MSLDRGAAEKALGELASELDLSLEETAAGVARVAGVEMAQAVRVVTVERGIDPRELALVPFGGAGPLHAARIADELGMRRVLVPVASGVLSALGLVVSERRRDLVESVLLARDDLTRERVAEVVQRLAERGREELDAPDAELRATYDLRYAGQAFELSVPGEPEPDPDDLRARLRRGARRALRLRGSRGRAGAGERARGHRGARRRAAARHARAGERARQPQGSLRRRACRTRRSSERASWRPRARRSSSCPARRWWCPRAGAFGPGGDAVEMERRE